MPNLAQTERASERTRESERERWRAGVAGVYTLYEETEMLSREEVILLSKSNDDVHALRWVPSTSLNSRECLCLFIK